MFRGSCPGDTYSRMARRPLLEKLLRHQCSVLSELCFAVPCELTLSLHELFMGQIQRPPNESQSILRPSHSESCPARLPHSSHGLQRGGRAWPGRQHCEGSIPPRSSLCSSPQGPTWSGSQVAEESRVLSPQKWRRRRGGRPSVLLGLFLTNLAEDPAREKGFGRVS